MMRLVSSTTDGTAEAAWEEHAANLQMVRRLSVDPHATDRQRRRAIEMSALSKVKFKRAFLAQREIAI